METWFFRMRLKFLMLMRTSSVSREDRHCVLSFISYDLHDISLAIFLFPVLLRAYHYVGIQLDVSRMVNCWSLDSCPHDQWYKCGQWNILQMMRWIRIRYVDFLWLGQLCVAESECNMRQFRAHMSEHGTSCFSDSLSYVRRQSLVLLFVIGVVLMYNTVRGLVLFLFSTVSFCGWSWCTSFDTIKEVLDIIQYFPNRGKTAVSGWVQRSEPISKRPHLLLFT